MPAADCGFTLMHEHPYCRLSQAPHRYDFPDQVEDDDVIAADAGAFVPLGADSLVGLLERGPYLVFDNCGQYRTLGQFEADILALIVRLINAGWERPLLLSHDTCEFPQFRRHGRRGLTYIPEHFLPR
jgi:predicted metal-dependent phosphotriesterase family hydrolase